MEISDFFKSYLEISKTTPYTGFHPFQNPKKNVSIKTNLKNNQPIKWVKRPNCPFVAQKQGSKLHVENNTYRRYLDTIYVRKRSYKPKGKIRLTITILSTLLLQSLLS